MERDRLAGMLSPKGLPFKAESPWWRGRSAATLFREDQDIFSQLATAQPSGTPSGNIYTRQTINLGFGKDLVLMLYALSFSQRKTLNFQL